MSSVRPASIWFRLLPLLLGALACAVHIGSLRNGFTFDDPYIVVENPLVTGAASLGDILSSHYWAGQDPRGDLYRPLTILSYRVNYLLAGARPWGFHLVNCLLHGAVTAVAFLLFRRMAGAAAAAAGALLFATHPIHTEAVASIVGRAELLAALAVLGAWLLRERTWASLALFACGLLAKENAVVLPGLLMVEDWVGGRLRSSLKRYVPFLVIAAGWGAARLAVLGPVVGAREGPFVATPPPERFMTAVAVFGKYLGLMLWPATLSADYSYDQIPLVTHPSSAAFLLGASCVAACLLAMGAAFRRSPAASAGLAVFFVALLPVSNVFFGIGVMMAERLLYLPSAGLCLAAGAAIEALCAASGAVNLLAATCLAAALPACALAARSAVRTADWFDQLTLFEATARAAPRSALARVNLGTIYQALGRLKEAESEFRSAVAIAPDRPGPHYDLGSVLERMGRLDEAAAEYEEAARIDPDDPRPRAALKRARATAARGSGTQSARP